MAFASGGQVRIQPGSGIVTGQIVVAAAGTRVQLTVVSQAVLGVTIRANADNAGDIFAGNVGVTAANGFRFGPGESDTIDIDDPAKLYLDAANNGDGVSWEALTP